MKFFDYVYYRVCKFYDNHGERSPGISGLVVISLMYYFNISIVLDSISIFLQKKLNTGILLVLVIFALLLLVNGFRYNRLNYQVLKNIWCNEDNNAMKKKGNG